MIDTITLRIEHPNFHVTHPEHFSPRAHYNEDNQIKHDTKWKDVYKEFTIRPSPLDKAQSIYKPTLTIVQKMKKDAGELEWFLSIQVSVPKLLFGDSVREINENCFEDLCFVLESKLRMMGVSVSSKNLRGAIVKKVHIAKNIILPAKYAMPHALSLIQKANVRELKDRQINYENGGEALHLYTSAYGIILYDKLKDLERNKNVAYDKDRTKNERITGKVLRKSGLQVLRFEIRYNGIQKVTSKINGYLQKSGDVLFPMVFKQTLWEAVLISEWESITGSNGGQLALKYGDESTEVIKCLLLEFGKKPKNVYALNQVLSYYGIFEGIQNIGVNAFRAMFDQKFSHKTVRTRLDQKIQEIASILKKIPTDSGIEYIDSQIRECKQITDNDIYD